MATRVTAAGAGRPRRRSRRRWAVAAALLLCFGVGLFLVITSLSRAMLFPRYAVQPMRNAGADVEGLERLWVETDDGRVEGWFLPGEGVSADAPGPAVVFAHGNAELIEHWPSEMQPYRDMGISVLLPEYRGYGRSAGSPSERAITDDFVAFYDQLVARPDVDAERIVFHGRSLGGGAVCALARHHRPRALVLQSTFTSVADIASRWLVPRMLLPDPFDSRDVLPTLGDIPVLIVHGRRDSLIPVSHAHELARAAPNSRLILYDCDHNDCPPFWREVETLLTTAGVR